MCNDCYVLCGQGRGGGGRILNRKIKICHCHAIIKYILTILIETNTGKSLQNLIDILHLILWNHRYEKIVNSNENGGHGGGGDYGCCLIWFSANKFIGISIEINDGYHRCIEELN